MGLSAVILTYNTPVELIQTCLNSILLHNDIKDDLQVILVDNNSENKSEVANFLTTHYPEVEFISNSKNAGYGAGNNLGIQQAKHDYIILINPDVEIIEPIFGWAVDRFNSDINLKLLGIQQVNQYNQKTHSFILRKLTRKCFVQNFILNKVNHFSAKYAVISGACFFLRKASFLEIGGYDENIFLYGEERYLHEHILAKFSNAKIEIDFSKKYKHPISDRKFSIQNEEYGLNSYFYLKQKLGEQKSEIYREVVNYYKTLIAFYTIKKKAQVAKNYNLVLDLLAKKFK